MIGWCKNASTGAATVSNVLARGYDRNIDMRSKRRIVCEKIQKKQSTVSIMIVFDKRRSCRGREGLMDTKTARPSVGEVDRREFFFLCREKFVKKLDAVKTKKPQRKRSRRGSQCDAWLSLCPRTTHQQEKKVENNQFKIKPLRCF